jgi:hypothetical protein
MGKPTTHSNIAGRANHVLVLVANHREVLPQERPARLADQDAAREEHEAVLQEVRVPGRVRTCARARMGVCGHACARLHFCVFTRERERVCA